MSQLIKRFHYEAVAPLSGLIERATRNICIEPGLNDVVSSAKQVAIAAHHFREIAFQETGNLLEWNDSEAQNLADRLRDVADTAKHGCLRDSDRTVSFAACLSYEFNETGQFRFMQTEVWAKNKRFGTFNLIETIANYLKFMASILGIEIDIFRPDSEYIFGRWAETFIVMQSGFDIRSVELRFYKRDEHGNFVVADPPEVQFRVLQAL